MILHTSLSKESIFALPMGDASQQRKCARLVTSSSAQLASTSSLFCQFYIVCHADPLVVSGFKNFHADTNAHSKYAIGMVLGNHVTSVSICFHLL